MRQSACLSIACSLDDDDDDDNDDDDDDDGETVKSVDLKDKARVISTQRPKFFLH